MDWFNKEKIESLNNKIKELNKEIEDLRNGLLNKNREMEILERELSYNKIDNKALEIKIKEILQEKQQKMNEYIDELNKMKIEKNELTEKTNRQLEIIITLQKEVKSVKDKFKELVQLSEEYKDEMESKLEKKIKIETEEQEHIIKLLNKDIERRQEQIRISEDRIKNLDNEYEEKRREMIRINDRKEMELVRKLDTLKEEIKRIEDSKEGFTLLQEINMIENPYEYESSQEFQKQLDIIKRKQKEMVRNGEALIFSTTWTVGNSKTKGDKFMKNLSKLALKSFNNECDNIIINIKYSSMAIAKTKIEKSFKDTNKFIEIMSCGITDEYLELKIKELQLKCGWLEKREQEKEELRKQQEILKEQEKLEKEIRAEEEKIEIEQQHFNNEITNLENQIANGGNEDKLKEEITKLQAKIEELERRKATVLERKMHNKAGYVYIISNPSLKGMFKVGVTKRLEPQVRIDELSSASVPFKFAVHSFIFSEDAFALEHTLHMAFDDKRVNRINKHKEFFYATLDEIKEEVYKYNPNAEFIDEAVVEDYILSMEMKKSE